MLRKFSARLSAKDIPPMSSPAKLSLDALLDSHASWFRWIAGAKDFEKSVKSCVHWDALDARSTAVVMERLKTPTPNQQTLLNSFYVTMVSGFEQFLRGKINEIAAAHWKLISNCAELDENVRTIYLRESGRLLARIDSPPAHLALSRDDLCRGLGSFVAPSSPVALEPAVFSNVDSLLLLDNFFSRVNTLGVSINLDKLGREASIRKALLLDEKAGARQVANALASELKIIRNHRNRIAHAGGEASEVSEETFRTHLSLIQSIADVIHRIV